jgi:hypothetical protein
MTTTMSTSPASMSQSADNAGNSTITINILGAESVVRGVAPGVQAPTRSP